MKRFGCRRSKSENNFAAAKLSVIGTLLDDKCARSSKSFLSLDDDRIAVSEKDSRSNEDDAADENDNYWPNCDASVWMRSCENEVIEPLRGEVSGTIPKWVRGTLLRNGPGSLKVGEYSFQHLFDSSALLHRFAISNGIVTYQRRFIQTDVYKKNTAAQRIVMTEFGTRAVPDPCQSIFHRVAAAFNPAENLSDNSMISVYPFGDEFYTFTEAPVMHKIDPETLETKGKVNLQDYVGIVNHSSHPHITNDGTVYNVGLGLTPCGPAYNVVCFSPSRVTIDDSGEEQELSMFDEATIVASIPSRWLLNPSYMHTFGITENYFVIVEQPLAISLTTMVCCQFKQEPLSACLKWHENENTFIHVISRETGQLVKTFVAEAFFYLHIINQFETRDRDYVVVDICCYRDARMLDCMYIEMLKNLHKNPEYPKLFRGRPLRFVLPMKQPQADVPVEHNLITVQTVNQSLEAFQGLDDDSRIYDHKPDREIIDKADIVDADRTKFKHDTDDRRTVLDKKAAAHRLPDGTIFVKPELLCDLGCETPRLNYDSYLGREYRFFYAISSDTDLDNPGTIIKVDTVKKTRKTWCENNVFPSEPIFVPDPNGKNEDDGVVLSALVWGQGRETEVGLLILDAATFVEIARATFSTPGPVPKCLHGWFALDK